MTIKFRGQRGFTLIEIILVIALMMILASVATISTRGLRESFAIKGATRTMMGEMQKARLGAIRGGRSWAICFEPGNTVFTRYSVRNMAGADGILCTTDDPLTGAEPFYRKDVDLGNELSTMIYSENFPGTKVEFNPGGSASGGNVSLNKVTDPLRGFKITVNSVTGNMGVKPLP